MIQSEDEIRARVTAAITPPERVTGIYIKGWNMTIVVNVGYRFGRISLAELNRLAEELEVLPHNIELWDGGEQAPNTIEISVDCDIPTPVERPSGKLR